MQQYEDLLRQRKWPAFWVIDEDIRVVLRLPGEGDLPQDIERLVGDLLSEARETGTDRLPLARLLHRKVLVRTAPLEGKYGPLTAVFVEIFETRNQLSAGSRKFGLTNRERHVLGHLAFGDRTAAIADKLGIAPSTVTLHIKSIMAKTESHTRAEMLARIIAHDADRREPRAFYGEITPNPS